MAKFCIECQKKLGLLGDHDGLCWDCYEKHQEEKRQLEEKERLEKQQKEEAERKERKLQEVKKIKERIENGEIIYVYKSVYINVDSYMFKQNINNGPKLETIYYLGLQGWEITGIVHRTESHELTTEHQGNSSGSSWGGSTSAVAGAYVILKKQIRNKDEISDQDLYDYVNQISAI